MLPRENGTAAGVETDIEGEGRKTKTCPHRKSLGILLGGSPKNRAKQMYVC